MTNSTSRREPLIGWRRTAVAGLTILLGATALRAQDTGVRGTVTEAESGRPLSGITVSVTGLRTAVTDDSGRYLLAGVDVGAHTLTFRRIGFAPHDETLTLAVGEVRRVDVVLARIPALLGMVHVTGVSRVPERVVDAPAAVSVVEPERMKDLGAAGQVPMMLADLPGIHLSQATTFDFNLNARGFNTPTNRRLLVLVDGRDVAVPLLGNQDWADLNALEPGTAIELVRGPGSALYGPNAFGGVLAINTPSVRETRGTRLSITGGQLDDRRVDGRYGWVAGDYRWGVRVAGGAQQSGTWDRSRTNVGDLDREYAAAGIAPGSVAGPGGGLELVPLSGQSKATPFGVPGASSGSLEPASMTYGTARVDYYPRDGSVVTAEGGVGRNVNLVIPGVGARSQTVDATRPWGRLGWTGDEFSVMAYYTGRTGHNVSLGLGTPADDESATYHVEGQLSRHFAGTRGRVVAGASARTVTVDTRGTLLAADKDGRADNFYGVFGQADYAFAPRWKAVVAARVDEGTLHQAQVSPKVALVFTPTRDQSIRLTWNRGYLTPSALERFIRFPAGVIDLSALEAGLRASPLGPALAGVPNGTLFTTSSAVPIWAIGNRDLRPEVTSGFELGWKAQVDRLFASVDAFYSRLTDFATELLPGTNPTYGAWTAPAAVPDAARSAVEAAVTGAVGPILSRLEDGATAVVLSSGNSGTAHEYGVELAAGVQLATGVRVDANYAYYGFSIDQDRFTPGDTVRPNTPPHTANVSVAWNRASGARARIGFRYEDAYHYRAGSWNGPLPATHAIDVNLAYPLTSSLEAAVSGTNVLDEWRVHTLGGSPVGRRVLLSLTYSR